MKLSENTFSILKNFNQINQNILITSNTNEIKTINMSKSIFATAKLEDEFPVEVGIYNLSEFLGTIRLLAQDINDVDFDFKDDHVVISSGKSKCVYRYAAKKVLNFPEKSIQMPTPCVEFEFSGEILANLKKVATTLSKNTLSFEKESDTSVICTLYDSLNTSGSVYTQSIECSSLAGNPDFKLVFAIQNLQVLPTNGEEYTLKLAKKGKSMISCFENLTVSYYIAVDQESTVEEE